MSTSTETPTKQHTIRVRTYGGKLEVVTRKDLGGEWGYTLPSGRRIVSRRDWNGRAVGFVLADGAMYPTLGDAAMASGEMVEVAR